MAEDKAGFFFFLLEGASCLIMQVQVSQYVFVSKFISTKIIRASFVNMASFVAVLYPAW